MLLEGTASDEKTYQVRLSCISADRNSAGIAVGEIPSTREQVTSVLRQHLAMKSVYHFMMA